MRKSLRHAVLVSVIAALAVVAAMVTATPAAAHGCTPGYYKNHTFAQESMTLEDVFDVPDALGLDSMTLKDALSLPGGPGVQGGAQILLRAAVASYLNTLYVPDFGFGTTTIVNLVNAALASGDRATMLDLATRLDTANNQPTCPNPLA
jgi:hypothetical protein